MADSNFFYYAENITNLLRKRIAPKSISFIDKNTEKMNTLLSLELLTDINDKMAQ
jgi:hypothetical protein